MQRFSNSFLSVRRSTCFRRVFRPSSAAQNCTYSVRHLSDRYFYLLLKFRFFCTKLYMFQTGFQSIISSTKLHIQRQAFVRPLLLPAVSRKASSRWFHLHRQLGTYLPMKMEQCVPKRWHIKFRRRGIIQKKAHNIEKLCISLVVL